MTRITYDIFGNVDTVTDPNNHVTDYDYNALHWLVQERNPLNFLTKYTRDQNGNVTKVERQADAGATQWQTVQMTYDVLNNLMKDQGGNIMTLLCSHQRNNKK